MLRVSFAIWLTGMLPHLLPAQTVPPVFFHKHADIGQTGKPGNLVFRKPSQEYELSGSGANIWAGSDAFHFAWEQLKGDFILQARLHLDDRGVEPHRKGGLMIRESLDSASAMLAVTVHGDGLAAVQFRRGTGQPVEEIRSRLSEPDMLQLERKGKVLLVSFARFGDPYTLHTIRDIPTPDEIFAGLFICSHNNDLLETAVFSNVQIIQPAPASLQPYKEYLGSHIEILEVNSGHRNIVHTDWKTSLQAPNWTTDGHSLIYNSEGLIYELQLKNQSISVIPTGYVRQNNNDHVLTADGKWLGLSSSSGEPAEGSLIYIVPRNGGTPRRVTPKGPSYLHGFSPDGKWMTYTGQRNNEFDIYKIPVKGGAEVRLTEAPGLDDGSEYSPDGKYIYFNSVRSGSMQLWRMLPDGSGQEQITRDEFNNWFPHVSPDGRWIVFLSYTDDVAPADHPFYKKVYLRMMPADFSTPPRVIAYVYGGQGTINTPSWSPDSRKISFVSNSGLVPVAREADK